MTKGLIILNAFTQYPEQLHTARRLQATFSKYQVTTSIITNDQVFIYLDNQGKTVCHLDQDLDFIVYLDKDYNIGRLLELHGYRLFNNADSIRICDDKMLTHVTLANHGIKMPKTISYPLRYNVGDDSFFHKRVQEELKFPLIIKECFGSLSLEVSLIKTLDEYQVASTKLMNKPHLYQEFIASSFGRDLRLHLINKKVVAHMYRTATTAGEFRSNIEIGGIGSQIKVPLAFIKMAEKAARILKLDYCGMDFLFDAKGGPVLLEVNSNAYLGPIEKFSEVNVADLYVKFILKQIAK
ncbi:MAG: RimK family alpha-L-glutamate ligase [Erysipelotrichaceae bacterium]|jgi:RimK family alpha-L-glutamate ligase|nr:RimK family alpha-L-glutamate ligase [Erysipelotrichaceae bacterium]